jgi:hypothetical protein
MKDEREYAIALAARVLDMPRADPDRDEAVLARQFLRAIEPEQVNAFRVWAGDSAKLLPDLTPEELDDAERRVMGERAALSNRPPTSVLIFYHMAAKAFATERTRRAK